VAEVARALRSQRASLVKDSIACVRLSVTNSASLIRGDPGCDAHPWSPRDVQR
jgi:hypothetical protein